MPRIGRELAATTRRGTRPEAACHLLRARRAATTPDSHALATGTSRQLEQCARIPKAMTKAPRRSSAPGVSSSC
eukprot:11683058-Heterocapsa_arctica.AAC.2